MIVDIGITGAAAAIGAGNEAPAQREIKAAEGKENARSANVYNNAEGEAKSHPVDTIKEALKAELKELKSDGIFRRVLHLEIEKDLHMVVAKIVDGKTNEVVRQIPPEEVVAIIKRLNQTGIIINREA